MVFFKQDNKPSAYGQAYCLKAKLQGSEGIGNIRPIARCVATGTYQETVNNVVTEQPCKIYEFDQVVLKAH